MLIKRAVLSSLIYIFSLLPFWVLYKISDFLYFVLFYIIKYRKEVVVENLKKSFPEKSADEIKRVMKDFYKFLSDLIIENIKMRTMTESANKKRLHILNPELPLYYLKKNQPIVVVTGHYGNWEWGIHSLSLMSTYPALIIYKPLSSKLTEELYNKMRDRYGAVMVPMKQTLRKIVEYRNKPHTSVFLGDQTPTRKESTFFIPFLNQPTPVFKGIEKIAVKMNFPIVYCHIDRIKRGYYSAEFTTLITDPKNKSENEITKIHNRFLEEIIIKKPELWLWSHKRWKHKPND